MDCVTYKISMRLVGFNFFTLLGNIQCLHLIIIARMYVTCLNYPLIFKYCQGNVVRALILRKRWLGYVAWMEEIKLNQIFFEKPECNRDELRNPRIYY
jgi:hypothetical protein